MHNMQTFATDVAVCLSVCFFLYNDAHGYIFLFSDRMRFLLRPLYKFLMYVRTYVCTYVCMYVRTYIHTYVRMYVRMSLGFGVQNV